MTARLVGFAVVCSAAIVQAQNLEVIVVPAVQLDSTAPHFAVNGRATTFKAIARGGNGTYVYEWDFEGDGTFDSNATTANRYNLSARFTYPTRAQDTRLTARLRVTSNGQTVLADYPVQIFADVPSDPNAATARQLQVLRAIVIENALWNLHNQMSRAGNEADPLTGAQVTGNLGGASPRVTAGAFLEGLARNGHLPAFPPAYLGTMPNPAQNAQRWATDPFAEDAMRVLNYLLANLQVVTVAPADEANDVGFYPTIVKTPLPGTDDLIGLTTGQFSGENPGAGSYALLRALAFTKLKGFVAQVGDSNRVLGKPFEVITQQVVDAVVWAQNEAGPTPGNWDYTPNTTQDLPNELGMGSLDAVQALWAVDTYLRDDVIVPNLARARATSYVLQGQRPCPEGGTGFPYSLTFGNVGCTIAQSFLPFFVLAWDGANGFSATDARLAFPGFSLNLNPTRGQLRTAFTSTQTFLTNTFPNGQMSNSFNWDIGYVVGGDFSRIDGQGDFFNMLHLMRAARSQEPELVTLGTSDFYRSITRFVINHQVLNGDFTWVLSLGDNSDNALGPQWRVAAAVIILSPDDAQPVVTTAASAATVAEGTAVTFTGQSNVAAPVLHAWTMGNGDTRSGSPLVYAYPDNGTFNVADTVTTDAGTSASFAQPITVTNVAPTVDAGPDVTIDEGSQVTFRGSFIDPGTADTWTTSWAFGDGVVLSAALSAPHVYADEGTFNATLTVTDDDLGAGSDTAVITVRNVAPLITSSPPIVASVGSALSYTLTFTDPGTTDTQTCSTMMAPSNAMLMGCALSWTPTAAQVGTQSFSFCVSDNDNGQTCQLVSVVVAPVGANLPPSAPIISAPALNARVATLQPTLVVTNATDPEGDPLTYEFEVLLRGVRVANQSNVAPGMTTTSHQLTAALTEDATYTWRARAVGAQGVGPWSDLGQFTVNATNTPPAAVTLLFPADGALVRTLTPTLTFLPWADTDGDTLSFDWEVGSDEQFTTVIASGTGLAANQVTLTMPLVEDSRACWRVRADDGQVKSAYSTACFRVSATNGAPSTVTHLSPAAGAALTTLSPVFAWTPATDPEGDALTYELVVTEGATTLATIATGGTAAILTQPLADGHSYRWKVRALTVTGPAGAFSTETAFRVELPDAGVPMAGGSAGGTAMAGGAAGGTAMAGGAAGGMAMAGGTAGGTAMAGGAAGGTAMAGGAAGGTAMAGGAAGGTAGGTTNEPPRSGCGCTSFSASQALAGLLLLLARRRVGRRA